MLTRRTSILFTITVIVVSFGALYYFNGPVSLNEEVLNVFLVYSVTVLLFPFVSVPFIYDALSKISPMVKGKDNVDALRSLFKDYLDGCFLVSFLAFTEIVFILVYLFTCSKYSGYLGIGLVSLVIAITLLLFALLKGLWRIWGIVGSDIIS